MNESPELHQLLATILWNSQSADEAAAQMQDLAVSGRDFKSEGVEAEGVEYQG